MSKDMGTAEKMEKSGHLMRLIAKFPLLRSLNDTVFQAWVEDKHCFLNVPADDLGIGVDKFMKNPPNLNQYSNVVDIILDLIKEEKKLQRDKQNFFPVQPGDIKIDLKKMCKDILGPNSSFFKGLPHVETEEEEQARFERIDKLRSEMDWVNGRR